MEIRVKSPSNIALIKYWGKSSVEYNLPLNSSLSLTLDLHTYTTLSFASETTVKINNSPVPRTQRLERMLATYRSKCADAHKAHGVRIESVNSFPTSAGLASSASGYSALAYGLNLLYQTALPASEVAVIARMGSGSACRSLYGGLVE